MEFTENTVVADLMISALRDAGHTACHVYTFPGYSAVVIELSDGSAIRVMDMDCSAHHTVTDHHPWWAAHLPDPQTPEVLESLYEGTGDTPFADDTAACVRAISAFIATY
jgi:hypothetical protein